MNYELDPARPLDAEVRRIAMALIDRAVEQIDNAKTAPQEAVHEVRKDCKKLRGLLRLIRPAAPKLYAQENAAVRDAAASLSGVRDVEAALETFDALTDHFRKNIDIDSLAPLRERLVDHKARVADEVGALEKSLDQAHAVLNAVRKRVPAWELPATDDDEDSWKALGPGLCKTYNRGRLAMQQAYAEPSVEAFHEWRKRVKYLRYQLRLVRAGWPHVLKAMHQDVKRLGDWLGDDHDLAVLAEVIDEAPELDLDNSPEQLLLALSAQRSKQLRETAYWLGLRLYAEKPKHLDKRLRRYWEAGQGLPVV